MSAREATQAAPLPRALRLGGLEMGPPVGLAPMAGFTTMPVRLLARRAGAGFTYTEMISAEALVRGAPSVRGRLPISRAEHPVVVQLLGRRPEALAEAARAAEALGADAVDLNLGCPAPDAVKSGSGAALASEPELAAECLGAMVAAVRVPVTAKLRAGAAHGDRSYLALARRLVDAGAAALALHARPACRGPQGEADWAAIAELVEAVAVPVIGNGDVCGGEDAARMMAQTGCAGVLVGRAALGNPWVFGELAAWAEGRPAPPPPSLAERLGVALLVAGMLADGGLGHRSMAAARRNLLLFLRDAPGMRAARGAVSTAADLEQVHSALVAYWERTQEGAPV